MDSVVSYNHSLRPVFTENILKLLQRGRSINLIGAPGNGRKRLLDDIRGCCLRDTTVVIINLKSYRQNHDSMITEMFYQLGFKGSRPQHLSELFEECIRRAGKIFILFYNFDSLLDAPNIDTKFDIRFYDSLNFIKNRDHISLLCVTQKPHDQSVVFIDGKDYSNSWLDLEKMYLRSLDYTELEIEIGRRQLGLTSAMAANFIDVIWQADKPYALLEFMIGKIVNRVDETIAEHIRFKKWSKQFQQENRGRYFSSRGVSAFKQKTKKWANLAELDSLIRILNVKKYIRDIFHSFIKKD